MILIGLNGKAGSGKDTAFSFIEQWAEQQSGVLAARRGFADMLKLSAYRLFKPDATLEESIEWANLIKFHGTVRADDADGMTKAVQITGREFLQRYGTESHRDVFGRDFWVDMLLPLGHAHPIHPRWWKNFTVDVDGEPVIADICVITDVRFENEAQRIKDLGGEVWTLVRQEWTDDHISEQRLPEYLVDRLLDNSGSIQDLQEEVLGNLFQMMNKEIV